MGVIGVMEMWLWMTGRGGRGAGGPDDPYGRLVPNERGSLAESNGPGVTQGNVGSNAVSSSKISYVSKPSALLQGPECPYQKGCSPVCSRVRTGDLMVSHNCSNQLHHSITSHVYSCVSIIYERGLALQP